MESMAENSSALTLEDLRHVRDQVLAVAL